MPMQAPLADYYLYCDGDIPLLFTENETNHARLFGSANASPYVKDGIDQARRAWRHVRGEWRAGGDEGRRAITQTTVGAGKTHVIRLRLTTRAPEKSTQAVRRLRCGVRKPCARSRCVLSLDHAACHPRRSRPIQRHAPGAGRHAVDQAVLQLRPSTPGSMSTVPGRGCRSTSAGTCATANGRTCTTTTSSRCRTSGNTRGTPHGTSRST